MEKKANKHELKTRETRELLLKAAEKVFVRNGYEGAELGEIATLAGRTKGAIYAQFKSKEDIFLALVEDLTLRYRAQMREMLAQSTSVEENLAALRKFWLNRAEDQAWALLLMEFKLFTIRHPESKKRLQSFFDTVLAVSPEKTLVQVLGPSGKGKAALSRSVAVRTMQPVISALALEAQFEPAIFGEDVIRKIVSRIYDVLLQTSTLHA
jgi:AcrR family transcriptional regulator